MRLSLSDLAWVRISLGSGKGKKNLEPQRRAAASLCLLPAPPLRGSVCMLNMIHFLTRVGLGGSGLVVFRTPLGLGWAGWEKVVTPRVTRVSFPQ